MRCDVSVSGELQIMSHTRPTFANRYVLTKIADVDRGGRWPMGSVDVVSWQIDGDSRSGGGKIGELGCLR